MAFTHATETAFQKGQLGVEVDWGTAVPATIALGSINIDPAMLMETNTFTPKGITLPGVASIGMEETDLTFNGQPSYEDLQYFLADFISDAQTDPLAYTVEAGGLQVPGAVVTDITLKGDMKVVEVSGKMKGKKATVAVATPGLVVATQTPLLAPPVEIEIAATPLTKAFAWEFSLANMWGGKGYIGDDTLGTIMQKAATGKFSVLVEADDTNMALLNNRDTQEITVLIPNGLTHSLLLTFDAKIAQPDPQSDNDGIYAIRLNYNIMNKATKAVEIAFTIP
jgi:hypothetical protein